VQHGSIAAVRQRRPDPEKTARKRPLGVDDTPECRHFGTCGGCTLLDQPIHWQLHDKVAAASELLAPHLGGLQVEHELPERPPQHFRSRLLYPVRERDGQPIVGIYEQRSHHVVRIEECRTQDVWLTGLGRAMEGVLQAQRLRAYVPGRDRGHVKAIWARLASGSGEVLAGIVTRPGTFAAGRAFADAVVAAAEGLPARRTPRRLVGVVHSISDRDDEFLLGDRHQPLVGKDHVVDRRDGLTFRISAGSFYQIHSGASDLLYAPALRRCHELFGDLAGKTVVDAYGGVGAFGLRLAKAGAGKVTIVEDNPSSCRDAEHNASANGLQGVQIVRSSFLGYRMPPGTDLLVVDPPRSGLSLDGVAHVLQNRPKNVLYVACAADSLARDLGPLLAGGYRLRAMRLFDLFPHTEHVELAAFLQY
jgi:23S rRNA (uracil1939-C5)-methyltransferase